MPEVSVIIPTYNREQFLRIAVKSVLEQTFEDFELIIIDDGSEDNTKEMLEQLNDKRIKYIYQFNRGPGHARNTALKQAKGQYLAFLDSDDAWVPEKLQIQLEKMNGNLEYLLSHTEEIWYKGMRRIKPKKMHRKKPDDIFKNSLKLCSISMSTVILKKEIFDEIGDFDETLEVCEDYDFWLRVTSKYPVLLVEDTLTVKQGGHYDQQSQKYFGLDKFRIYAIEKIIKSSTLSPEQHDLAMREFKKKCRIYGNGCKKYGKEKEGEYYIDLPEQYNKTD